MAQRGDRKKIHPMDDEHNQESNKSQDVQFWTIVAASFRLRET
jgi:hypothetical protein